MRSPLAAVAMTVITVTAACADQPFEDVRTTPATASAHVVHDYPRPTQQQGTGLDVDPTPAVAHGPAPPLTDALRMALAVRWNSVKP